jgi:hypothetical protein
MKLCVVSSDFNVIYWSAGGAFLHPDDLQPFGYGLAGTEVLATVGKKRHMKKTILSMDSVEIS